MVDFLVDGGYDLGFFQKKIVLHKSGQATFKKKKKEKKIMKSINFWK